MSSTRWWPRFRTDYDVEREYKRLHGYFGGGRCSCFHSRTVGISFPRYLWIFCTHVRVPNVSGTVLFRYTIDFTLPTSPNIFSFTDCFTLPISLCFILPTSEILLLKFCSYRRSYRLLPTYLWKKFYRIQKIITEYYWSGNDLTFFSAVLCRSSEFDV